MTTRARLLALAACCSGATAACLSLTVARDSGLVVTGHVYDDPAQAGRVSLDTEDVQPAELGVPVPGCEVQVARRAVAGQPSAVVSGGERSDGEGFFSVFGGEQPGPREMTLTIECPGYAAVEHVFLHRGPRRYRASVFVARNR